MNHFNSSFQKEGKNFVALTFPPSLGQSSPKKPKRTPQQAVKSSVPMAQNDRVWLKQFSIFVNQHFSDSGLKVPDLAASFTTSESSLLRRVRRLTGLTPVQYLRHVRLQHAMTFLQEGTFETIREVAYQVGYQSIDGFTRNFKQQFGVLPSSYLK